ncbi:lipoprotein-releasing system ATP-binding protein [Candidatus Caldarchaeum subterraneum]|uniref:ABC transport system ATP-binding protein n=1 Tax=Caldiarchaeum subterraneum TaxID=311458 RepID=E6N374_CALS0|nr:ABC transport system ATP-binding protein [Candidatus Caldarchaeum subterraneum]BAJ49615.1 lipoprotein-releasing system ATP-binding protein [Candidatus Caldarchaeum subterraneum]BAJ51246.1 lipoprotein-releasing system ATP-binding protein [Candidatus Caldarchaeum subterraneum]GBC72217.1 Lipoprotein-releasing system ATP-binding protein LolD [archaeon HR03]
MSGDYVLVVENLKKVYRNNGIETVALNGVDFKVRRGEMVAIVGPSGSGKSTLLNMLGALDRPTEGRVIIDGVDISHADDDKRALIRNKLIGFVFQSYNLINRLTAIKNVEMPLAIQNVPEQERRKLALEMLKEVGLESKAYKKPTQLSGGEQQRVAIARALVTKPSIILADEPTGNLDSKSGAIVVQLLKNLAQKGHTVIVVTHNMEVAREADRIIYIRDGKIEKEEINTVTVQQA